jgi:hypothetical protein
MAPLGAEGRRLASPPLAVGGVPATSVDAQLGHGIRPTAALSAWLVGRPSPRGRRGRWLSTGSGLAISHRTRPVRPSKARDLRAERCLLAPASAVGGPRLGVGLTHGHD